MRSFRLDITALSQMGHSAGWPTRRRFDGGFVIPYRSINRSDATLIDQFARTMVFTTADRQFRSPPERANHDRPSLHVGWIARC